jgi:hypothetical protein
MKEPTDDDLIPFGCSPRWDYGGGHCRTCGTRMMVHGRRDWRCKPCAVSAWWEWRRTEDVPHICDLDVNPMLGGLP